jgi:hypothetical protein
MPGYLPADPRGDGFAGLPSIYQFTNADGQDPDTVCGLAACATLLAYCGAMPRDLDTLRQIEKSHPADLLFGKWGTSPWRVEEALKHYGAKDLRHVNDEETLKQWVRNLYPVICLIQNTGGLLGLRDGAHWFVVFAYDDAGVFVTNYDTPCLLSWDDFRAKWDSLVSKAAGVILKGITNTSRVLTDQGPGVPA